MGSLARWFSGIRGRLLLMIAVPGFAIIGMSIYNWAELNVIDKELDEITDVRMPSIKGLEMMNEGQTAVSLNLADLILASNEDERDEAMRDLKAKQDQIKKGWAIYEPLPQTPEEAKEWKLLEGYWKQWEAENEKVLQLSREGKKDAAHAYLNNEAKKAFSKAEDSLAKVLEINYKVADEAKLDIQNQMAAAIRMLTLLAFSIPLLTLLIGIYTAGMITKPISQIAGVAEKIGEGDSNQEMKYVSTDELGVLAEAFRKLIAYFKEYSQILGQVSDGDLTVSVKPRSERDLLGNSLKKTVEILESTMTNINESVVQVTSGAGQVSSASQSLSQGATEQAASLEEISSSITEISSQTKTNAENATQANQLARVSREAAERGKGHIETTVQAMGDINNSSQQISKIIKVIDDIAFQTNLLALNAAVEAARAGKHGKGFAVVADEVRNLAGRSAKAAKETAELIESSGKKVENGLKVATQTSEAFQEIMGGIVKVTDLVGEIAAASNEQAQGVAQISQGLTQIDQVTQQNTANAEETASAAEELSGQAQEVQRLVAQFKVQSGQRSAVAAQRSVRKQAPKAMVPHAKGKPALIESKVVKPDVAIALDERDFGKY